MLRFEISNVNTLSCLRRLPQCLQFCSYPYHCSMFRYMGLDQDSVMIIHMGVRMRITDILNGTLT